MGTIKKQRWIEQIKAQKEGREAPESTDPGSLLPTSVWAWNAFVSLNSQRHTTERGHPLPIAISEVDAYARLYDLRPIEGQVLLGWMIAMDKVYLDHRYSQIEQENKKRDRKARTRR